MATFKGPFNFNGCVGGFRGYWDSDAKKQIIATKKSKDKKQNENSDRVLELNNEFKGVTLWSKTLLHATTDIVYLRKGRLIGFLNRIAKQIQVMDLVGKRGYRKIESSKFNYPLKGFSFNKMYPFKDVFQVVPELSITEDRREVTLKLSDFRSASKFKWPKKVHYYRIFLLIIDLPDVEWFPSWERYYTAYALKDFGTKTVVSDWNAVSGEPIDFQISAAFDDNQLPKEKSTVVVVMGLEFASAIEHNTPYVLKGHGTAGIVDCI